MGVVVLVVMLLVLLAPVGAIVFSKSVPWRTRSTWACVCALALVAGLAIAYLRMRYIAALGLPHTHGHHQSDGLTFVFALPWLVYLCFVYQTSGFPKISNLVLAIALVACTALGFLSITAPPEQEIAAWRRDWNGPSAIYVATGIVQIASPWLQVLVVLVAFAIWLCVIAAFSIWIDRNVVPAFGTGVFATPERARLVRAGIGFLVKGLVLAGALLTALVFGEIGRATGLGRDPLFLTYWVALLFASVVPFCYFLRRYERSRA